MAATWLENLEDDWLSDGALPKAHNRGRSMIPRLARRDKTSYIGANLNKADLCQPSAKHSQTPKDRSLEAKAQDSIATQHTSISSGSEMGDSSTLQGTVQKQNAAQDLTKLVNKGKEDLFSPIGLENMFKPPDGSSSPNTCSPGAATSNQYNLQPSEQSESQLESVKVLSVLPKSDGASIKNSGISSRNGAAQACIDPKSLDGSSSHSSIVIFPLSSNFRELSKEHTFSEDSKQTVDAIEETTLRSPAPLPTKPKNHHNSPQSETGSDRRQVSQANSSLGESTIRDDPFADTLNSNMHIVEAPLAGRKSKTTKRTFDGQDVASRTFDRKIEPRPIPSFPLPSPLKENQPKRLKVGLLHEKPEDYLKARRRSQRPLRATDVPGERPPSAHASNQFCLDPEIDFVGSSKPDFGSRKAHISKDFQQGNVETSEPINMILASKVKHLIPNQVGKMIFDEEHLIWRRKGQGGIVSHQNTIPNGSLDSLYRTRKKQLQHAEVGNSSWDLDTDPFHGISDLSVEPFTDSDCNQGGTDIEAIASSYTRNLGHEEPEGELWGRSRLGLDLEKDDTFEPVVYNDQPQDHGLGREGPEGGPQSNILEDALNQQLSQLELTSSLLTSPVRIKDFATARNPKTKAPQTGLNSRKTFSVAGYSTPVSGQMTMMGVSSSQGLSAEGLGPHKLEVSLFGTPLTDITYHFLDTDGKSYMGTSRHDFSRNRRLLLRSGRRCFTGATRNMVKFLTDHDAFEPYWDQNKVLEIQNKGLTDLHGLDGFHPNLIEVNLERNDLVHLTNMPATVRSLKIASNQLSDLTAWGHLHNLQILDISDNKVESLAGLKNLVHLRDLKADRNEIPSLEGILYLDGLQKLRLRNNRLSSIDFRISYLANLSTLDLGGNCIGEIHNLSNLPSLEFLNLDSNNLGSFHNLSERPIKNLRSLNLSNNNITMLDVTPFPNLRTLYADVNNLELIQGITNLRYLDSVSTRSQRSLYSPHFEALREVRKVFTAGNNINTLQLSCNHPNLQYLELASCAIAALPSNFGRLMNNLRVLNLNNNGISDIKPLFGILRLNRLTLAGNRIANLQRFTGMLKFFPFLSNLDLRHNPLTLGYYGFLPHHKDREITAVDSTDPSPFLYENQDSSQDNSFRESMTEDTAVSRRCYEILVGEYCRHLVELDGLPFQPQKTLKKDRIWERMTELGLLSSILSTHSDNQ